MRGGVNHLGDNLSPPMLVFSSTSKTTEITSRPIPVFRGNGSNSHNDDGVILYPQQSRNSQVTVTKQSSNSHKRNVYV